MHFPTAKDVYFRAKQTELIMQYQSARTFLGLSQTEEWCYNKPIKEAKDPKILEILYIDYMSKLMEVALLYYNIVVDLSWVMVYVSVESFIYPQKDLPPIRIDNIMPIEDAFKILREAEKNSVAPSKDTNPIHYIRKAAPKFNEAIKLVEEFWNRFSACNIRNLYNYIKHRGLPLYKGLEVQEPSLQLNVAGKKILFSTQDVMRKEDAHSLVAELIEFDDNELYPYIKSLIHVIESVLSPSDMIL